MEGSTGSVAPAAAGPAAGASAGAEGTADAATALGSPAAAASGAAAAVDASAVVAQQAAEARQSSVASSSKVKVEDQADDDGRPGDSGTPFGGQSFGAGSPAPDADADTGAASASVAEVEGGTAATPSEPRGPISVEEILGIGAYGRAKQKVKYEPPKPGPKRKRTPLKTALEKLIIQLCRKDTNMYFAEPVPVDEVPGYLDIVKQPMDFGTIRTRVEVGGHYHEAAPFVSDVLLVLDNAMLFNPPDTSFYVAAERIRAWFEKAAARELSSDAMITPREEEEERQRHESTRRNLALGLRADGRPKRGRGGSRPRGGAAGAGGRGLQLPADYIPAALQYGVVDVAAADAAGATATPERTNSAARATPRDGRSVTPGGGAARASGSPFPPQDRSRTSVAADGSEPGEDDGSGAAGTGTASATGPGTPAGGRTAVDAFRRRLAGPRSSLSNLRASSSRNSLGAGRAPRINAELIADRSVSSLPFSYLPDGSIDPDDIEDARALLLSISDACPGGGAGVDASAALPTLESTVPVSFDIAERATLKGRGQATEAFEAALLTEPGDPTSSYSHDLTGLPDPSQHLPYTLPTRTSGPWLPPFDPEKEGVPLHWPVKPPYHLTPAPKAGDSSGGAAGRKSVGGAASPAATATYVPGTYSRDFDWTYNHQQTRVRRLLSAADLGTTSVVVPARAISAGGQLSQYHYLHGDVLRAALAEEIASVPAMSLKLPGGAPPVPTDLTHLIWTNMYRDYRPQLDDTIKQGLKGAALVRSTLWGDSIGESYARSVAEFVAGAEKGVRERYGPPPSEEADAPVAEAAGATDEAARPQLNGHASELHSPAGEKRTSPLLSPLSSPAAKRVKLEDGVKRESPAHADEAPQALEPLDRPLADWVRDFVISPLTNHQLRVLDQIAAGFRDAHTAQDLESVRSRLPPAENGAAAPTAAEVQQLLEEALRQEEVSAEQADTAAEISSRLARTVAESFLDPSPRMRLAELNRLFASRFELAEFITGAHDLFDTTDGPTPGKSPTIVNESAGEHLLTFRGLKGPAAKDAAKLDAALKQYAKLLIEITKRQREPQRKALLEALRSALLFACIKHAEPAQIAPINKTYGALIQSIRNERPPFSAPRPVP